MLQGPRLFFLVARRVEEHAQVSVTQHAATLGTPFSTPYAFDDPMFREGEALLGVFDGPQPARVLAVVEKTRASRFSS